MKREFKVEANVGARRSPTGDGARQGREDRGRFVRQTGGLGQYGIVYIDMEPAPGEGFDFVTKIKGGAVPTEFILLAEKGCEESAATHVKAGYPMVDVRDLRRRQVPRHGLVGDRVFKVAGSLAQGGRQGPSRSCSSRSSRSRS